eukprot:CAMPEP_0182884654 /NCGR_PEP_ID=MMETSP0034_2-20130328/19135_1 /TAXON_ID=156128 /ORGANISM="Nephroselmis pyriformis, Strain CCMP717" /LENGTH=162 /DNA_ID=CAMNT_0025017871 /DNA_START=400 /DNA_END=884 /DNA_ORIENTATION=+
MTRPWALASGVVASLVYVVHVVPLLLLVGGQISLGYAWSLYPSCPPGAYLRSDGYCSDDSLPVCPWNVVGGWVYRSFNEKASCYRLFGSTTYLTAKANCEQYNLGYLASIHSSAENAFLSSLNGGGWLWIGRTTSDSTWADGSSIVYNNFHPGEPSGDGPCL